MVLRRSAGLWLALASVLIVEPTAWAEELRVMDTGPVNKGTESGRIDEFYVRFNQPVDHIKSEFIIKRGNDVVQVLHARDRPYRRATIRWSGRSGRSMAGRSPSAKSTSNPKVSDLSGQR